MANPPQFSEQDFARSFDENFVKLRSFAIRRLGASDDDAEELAQEVLLAFWENLRNGSYKQTASISTYLISILKKKNNDRLREKNPLSGGGPGQLDGDRSPDDLKYDDERALAADSELMTSQVDEKDLIAALNTLSEDELLALHYYYEKDLSLEQVGELFGKTSRSTGLNRVRAAQTKLAAYLKKCGYDIQSKK